MATDFLGNELPHLLPNTDCTGCVAPCCSRFTMGGRYQALASGVVQLRHWRTYDARLRLVAVERRRGEPFRVLQFTCMELEDGRCSMYDYRPYACIVYDCRADSGRMSGPDDATPRCSLPRRT